jgi:hypothetical protein
MNGRSAIDIHTLLLTVPLVSWAGGEIALRQSEAFNDKTGLVLGTNAERPLGL